MVENIHDLIIRSFYQVRNIPYHVNVMPMDYQESIRYCQKNMKGSCTPKHLYLGNILQSLGINVKYHASLFLWKDVPLDYPKELMRLVEKLSPTTHLSLIISHDTYDIKDIFIDASWDPGISGIGVKINDLKLSESGALISTSNAVSPLYEKIFNDPYEYMSYVNSCRIHDDLKKNFYYDLNNWFEDVRKNGRKN